jgi:hypothetical protein
MLIPFAAKFALTSYTFFSLLTSGIYILVYANWANDICVPYDPNTTKNFTDRLIQFSITEIITFAVLIGLITYVNQTNETKCHNQVIQSLIKAVIVLNIIFQTIWLMLLVPGFTSDIESKCSDISDVYQVSVIGLAFHISTVAGTILGIIIFLINYQSDY